MTLPTTVADQRRYLEGGLVDLACDHCGGVVRVRKHSPEQTSVQWTVAAADGCAEFAMRRDAGRLSALVVTCGRLRATIDRAVGDGRLQVVPAEGTPVEPAPRGASPHGEPPREAQHENAGGSRTGAATEVGS